MDNIKKALGRPSISSCLVRKMAN